MWNGCLWEKGIKIVIKCWWIDASVNIKMSLCIHVTYKRVWRLPFCVSWSLFKCQISHSSPRSLAEQRSTGGLCIEYLWRNFSGVISASAPLVMFNVLYELNTCNLQQARYQFSRTCNQRNNMSTITVTSSFSDWFSDELPWVCLQQMSHANGFLRGSVQQAYCPYAYTLSVEAFNRWMRRKAITFLLARKDIQSYSHAVPFETLTSSRSPFDEVIFETYQWINNSACTKTWNCFCRRCRSSTLRYDAAACWSRTLLCFAVCRR